MCRTIIESLIKTAEISSKSVSFLDMLGKELQVSYKEMLQHSITFASHLKNYGLSIDDRVVIILSTCPEFTYAFFGTMLAGGIPVPVAPAFIGTSNLEYYMNRVEFIISDSQSKFLVTTGSDYSLFQNSCWQENLSFIDISEINFNETKAFDCVLPDSDQVCYIQYTSGSTGTPKGVVLTHDNVLKNIEGIGRAVNVRENEVVVSWLPIYHDMGLVGGVLLPVHYTVALALMPPELFVARPIKWLELISKYQATMSPGNNFAYSYCLKKIKDEQIKGLDLSSWRVAFNGSEPIDIDTINQFYEKFKTIGYKKSTMMPCYGLAEATLGVTFAPPDEEPQILECKSDSLYVGAKVEIVTEKSCNTIKIISTGKPIYCLDLAIIGSDNNELGEGYVGRIGVASDTIMKGYLEKSTCRRELLRNRWLMTGDIGFIYEGNLYVTGREKEVVIIRGKNFSLVDIENVLRKNKKINHYFVAFSYIDAEKQTEALGIVIEIREETESFLEGLKEQILREMSNSFGFVPEKIVFASPHTIPRTMNGKIRRNHCRELFV